MNFEVISLKFKDIERFYSVKDLLFSMVIFRNRLYFIGRIYIEYR